MTLPRRYIHVLWLGLLAGGAVAQDLPARIRAAQSAGDYGRAAAFYRELIASGEDTAEIRSNLAAMLHLAGRESEAVTESQNALQRNPNLPAPNLIAGLALSQRSRWAEALPYLERAQQNDPRGVVPLIALGQAYAGLRNYSLSNAAYLQATKLDDSNAEAWYGLGITYRALADKELRRATQRTIPVQARHNLDLALGALSKAVELDPSSPRARLILAESYRDSNKYTEAIAEYEAILRASPDYPPAELGLATTYWKGGEVEKAIEPLGKVLSRSPDDGEANAIMAQILARRGEFKQAAPYAARALRGNPALLQVRFVMAKIYLAENRTDIAIAELEKAAPADTDGSYHYLLHRVLKSAGRDREAAEALAEFRRLRAASRSGGSQ